MQTGPASLPFSIHLFKLAKLNSEIKYVAMSIVREAPSYAYPTIVDYNDWQRTMLTRLDEWALEIPARDSNSIFIHTVCQIQHQSLKMVLLRPSPAIPNPPRATLRHCHDAAAQNLKLIGNLYKSNLLIQSWDIFYALVLSAITRMYCIKNVPELAREIDAEGLLADMGDCLSILSATGEHWPGAKRCRDILDDLGRALVKWLKEPASRTEDNSAVQPSQEPSAMQSLNNAEWNNAGGTDGLGSFTALPEANQEFIPTDDMSTLPFFGQQPFDPFPAAGWPSLPPDAENMDAIIRSLFDDFIPDSGDYFQPH